MIKIEIILVGITIFLFLYRVMHQECLPQDHSNSDF